METVVNNPPPQRTTDGGAGLLIAAIVLLAVVVLLFVYGIPYISSMFRSSSPQVNVPGRVDVNIHTPHGK